MPGTTPHFGLHTMQAGENFSDKGYKHTNADRQLIDLLLYIGTVGHHHTGVSASEFAPEFGPTVTLQTSGGLIPSGKRVYYKITYVDVLTKIESAASPEVYVDTPALVQEPLPADLSVNTSGGTLTGGTWFYVLSAYVGSTTEETRALATNSIQTTGSTNAISLALPTLPTGATGFNIYRRGPGDNTFKFLASHGAGTYTDNGGTTPNLNRGLPSQNTTNAGNAITVFLPGATPSIPDGLSWKIYRTFVNGEWDNSYLATIPDPDVVSFVDTGISTMTGRYPDSTVLIDNPTKIDLLSETDNFLPPGRIEGFPVTAEFRQSGLVHVADLPDQFVNPYPFLTLVGGVLSLGRGSHPAVQPLKIDILYSVDQGVTFTSFWDGLDPFTNPVPSIPVGENQSHFYFVNAIGFNFTDTIVVNITQAGGGASPTDDDFTLRLFGYAYDFNSQADGLGDAASWFSFGTDPIP